MFPKDKTCLGCLVLSNDHSKIHAEKGCVEMYAFHMASLIVLTGHGIKARTHAHAEITHIPTQCIIRTWKALGLWPHDSQPVMMHLVAECVISAFAWIPAKNVEVTAHRWNGGIDVSLFNHLSLLGTHGQWILVPRFGKPRHGSENINSKILKWKLIRYLRRHLNATMHTNVCIVVWTMLRMSHKNWIKYEKQTICKNMTSSRMVYTSQTEQVWSVGLITTSLAVNLQQYFFS